MSIEQQIKDGVNKIVDEYGAEKFAELAKKAAKSDLWENGYLADFQHFAANDPLLIKTGLFDDWMHFFWGRYGIRPENEVLFAAQTWIIDKANKMEGKYKEKS